MAATSEPLVPPALGPELGIRRLSLPTPFAVGRVNCYLIEDDPLTLIDTGPNSADTLVELVAQLGACGHRVEDLGLIVLTHQHMDHFGLVGILASRSGAEVATLEALAPWLQSFPESMEADDAYAQRMLAAHGVPADTHPVLRAVAAVFHGWGTATTVTLPLHEGSRLELRDRTLTVSHRPGHSPSDTVLADPGRKLLFAGDHLLGHISSNAALTRPLSGPAEARPRPLVQYLASLTRTRAEDHALVLPGHGEAIDDHRALIESRFALHERRREKLLDLISARPRTAYELAGELWGNVAVTQAFLTISEVVGHVDLLTEAGLVNEVRDEAGVIRYHAQ